MKRIILFVLCFFFLFCTFGCTQEEVEDTDMITLRWMIPGKTPEDLPLVTEKINEITTKKIGARVEFQYVDTGVYQEKMEGYMATAYEYDLAFGGAYNTLINAASKGGILSLDEMIQKHPKLKEAIPDYAWELTKYNGEIYGVPNLQVLPMVYAVSCEKRWLEKIGGFDPYSINKLDEYIQEGADLTVWEDTMEYNDSAKLTPFAGFSINNENIREELEQIDEIVDSYPVIHLGAANPDDYYDEFLQKLKEAGADKVVAEYERQINEFMKEKLN